MSAPYAKRIQAETPTKIHVNNPTPEEAVEALAYDVVGATTNPTYVGRLLGLDAAKSSVLKEMDAIIPTEADDHAAMEKLEIAMVSKIAALYMPTFEATGGRRGFVFIQGNPFKDGDSEYMVEEARRFFAISPNIVVKLPGNFAATKAYRVLAGMKRAICITSCLSLPQEEEFFGMYRDFHADDRPPPPFFVTTLAGIMDEFLKKYAADNDIRLSEDALDKAGNLFAKLGYAMQREKGYPGVLLGGGARGMKHFTELVGSATESTLNHVFIKQMNEANPPTVERYRDFYADSVKQELLDSIPWYRNAIERGSMRPEEFDAYPPLVYFRGTFTAAWERAVGAIRTRRRQ